MADFNRHAAASRISASSNFRARRTCDFDAFRFDKDAGVRYIRSPQELGNADMLVLPGSKIRLKICAGSKDAGFTSVIQKFPGLIFGICGGYQRLAEKSSIKKGGSQPWRPRPGTGLFEMRTVFEGQKIMTNVTGSAFDAGFTGMKFTPENPSARRILCHDHAKEGKPVQESDGDVVDDRVFGTYIHGIFDSSEFWTGSESTLLDKIVG